MNFNKFVDRLGMGNSFWDRVQALMSEKGMTHQELAKILNVPLASFRGWFYRNVLPRADHACVIAQTLGTTVEFLITGKDPQIDSIMYTETLKRVSVDLDNASTTLKALIGQL